LDRKCLGPLLGLEVARAAEAAREVPTPAVRAETHIAVHFGVLVWAFRD
jgi:hypothetical protein